MGVAFHTGAMTEHWQSIATERRAMADLWEVLGPEQWATRSLCPDWTVHAVACHLVSVLEADRRTKAAAFVHGRGVPTRATEWLTATLADWSGADLAAALRRQADNRFAPPGMGSRAALTDIMVHRVDIVVPLELPVDRPVQHWAPVLDFLLRPLPTLGMIRGGRPSLSYRAADLDWQHGSGPEVTGPAAALATTVAGRDALADQLGGPGAQTLRAWAGASPAS